MQIFCWDFTISIMYNVYAQKYIFEIICKIIF